MTIATDPKSGSLDDSDDEFAKHFEEFASGKTPDPDPKEPTEPAASEGNGPEEEPAAPAEEEEPNPEVNDQKGGEPEEAATEEGEAPETATSDEAKPEGGDKPPEGEAPDPLANLPQEARDLIAKIEKERDEARHKANSDASRVAALSRKLQQLSSGQISSAPAAPENQPTEAQKVLDNKIKQLREDYGEIADPLIELIEAQRQELNHVRTSLAGMSEAQQAHAIAQEREALQARHPDWQTIAQSPDFAGWLEIQPENIQRLASSWDARETSVVLTLFKAESGAATDPPEPVATTAPAPKVNAATDAKRSQQLDGGRDVRSRPAPAASGPPDDFEAAFKYFEEKRRLAKTGAAAR